ncbi:hypothetical protein D0N50_10095 [Erwinia billingiae]|uniref:hypothetical protein n=1 Tax=Erwinia billingiae TaxID=182337 RepID=UPI00124758E1|nr:hypothetical protein [Erwinia billingiae]QEW32004.1 hypothetical protein D0N50_10095 [Erwinia billingiae]
MNEQSANLLKDITERIGWKSVRSVVGRPLGYTATGLEPFIERIQGSTADEQTRISRHISDVWRSLLLSGTRLVKLYKIDENQLVDIQTSLSYLQPDTSIFSQNYPYPLSQEQLISADADIHYVDKVSSIVQERQLETTILTSKAYYTNTIELDASHLSVAGLELRTNGGEIKCKTREVTQCFNTIMVLPSLGLLAITIDLSIIPRAESERQQFLVDQFLRASTGITLPPPIDLFDLVQEMYEQLDGRVSQIAFITSDGNTSSLKLKPGQDCLRTDSYHHGGETASPILTKFKLGKMWDITDTSSGNFTVELELPGKRAMIDKPNSHLYDAVIDKCSTVEQVFFVISKMLASLEVINQRKITQSVS